ncbi:NUDIX hydrolase [Streptomyces acidicola]|uniref:NUDIX hydrolase n=1 Tax=Streptomyces acidicola TaxID=2596892 RepID=UPI003414FFE0
MPTPDFIRELRTSVGHQLLWLPGVTAIVFDDEGRVLLNRRSDTGKWAVIGGIPDPGEQPAACAVREVFEETGVQCVAERVVVVQALGPVRYDNEDVCQYMDTTFRCRAVGGEACVNDDESLEVDWFEVAALPELNEFALLRIKQAMSDGPTWFDPMT